MLGPMIRHALEWSLATLLAGQWLLAWKGLGSKMTGSGSSAYSPKQSLRLGKWY